MLRRTQCKPTILSFISEDSNGHLSQTLPVSSIESLALGGATVHNGIASTLQHVSTRSTAKEPDMHLLISKVVSCLVVVVPCWAMLFGTGLAQQNPSGAKGLTGNIVRPEYYTANDFFADGQTSQAAIVFEAALAQSRMVNNQRGIDSVPPLVKLGECYWEQCDIGMALERYDAALQISLASQRWLSLLKPLTGNIRAEARVREIPWAVNTRGTQLGAYNEAWPIALGSSDSLLETATGQLVTGKMVSIDALEILRCQAIALRRRYQLLGPLAKHNPLARPLLKAFSVSLTGQSEAIQAAMNICSAMAAIGTGERVASAQLLTQNLSVGNGLDHPLTAVALLALADLAIESNEILLAEERALEASIVAGRAGQMDHLAEAVEYLSETGFVGGRDSVAAKMIQQIAQWSVAKSRMVTIRGQVEYARLSALVGDLETANKQCSISTTMLLPKPVVMPRAESVVRYAQARVAFLEGNLVEGINKLFESIAYLRGNEKGIGSPALFQLDLALQLTKSKALDDTVAEVVLGELLRSPSAGHWRVHPLEQLDWLMVDKSEANTLLVEIQLRTRNVSEMAAVSDDATRKRYRRLNELESRVFDLKLIFHSDNRFVGNTAEASRLRKQIPIADQNVAKIQQMIAPLQANPKWDIRKWTEDESRRWESAIRLSTSQESLLWAAAISPLVIAEAFPPRHSQEFLAKSLRPNDAVVMFASHGTTMRGYLYLSGKWRSWEVGDFAGLERKTVSFLSEMQLLKNRDGSQMERKNWGLARRIEIRNQLFPKDIWTNLIAAERWIVVPDGTLWYLPLEMLPLADGSNSLPCISEHAITYSPTLGLVPFLLDAKSQSKSIHGIDVHLGDFLLPDGHAAKAVREDLAAKKRFIVDLSGKPSTHAPSHFFKIASDCIHNYTPMNWDSIAPVLTDPNPNQSNIKSWSQLPWGSPASMLLTGVNALPPSPQATGDEWLRLTLPLIAQGTRQFTVSRWPVGGESTVSLIRSFQENQEDLSVSDSWQRSVLTLWEEHFDQRNEPLFKGAPFANSENTVSGSHPLLWSGYLRIGDSK